MVYEHGRLRSALRFGLALVAMAVFAATAASAQTSQTTETTQTTADGFSLGLAGGFARGSASPFGGNLGYYLLPTLEFPSPVRFIRPRADLFFADWGTGHVTALTANVLFTPVSGKRVAPYALAGAGAYTQGGSAVKAGWTLGLGLRLPGELRAVTIESRVHAFLKADRNAVPYDNMGSRWRYVVTPIGLGIQF